MFAILFIFISSEVIEISKDNYKEYVGGQKPLVLKFYIFGCPHCAKMAPEFDESSRYFPDLIFASIDCISERSACKDLNVTEYPSVKVYNSLDGNGNLYRGKDLTTKSFNRFITKTIGIRGKTPPSKLVKLNPYSFEKYLQDNNKCAIITFYAPWCQFSKQFLPEVERVSRVYEHEPNVSVGSIDCEEYKDFCQTNWSISNFPTMKVIKSNVHSAVKYTGKRIADNVVEFINLECGLSRQMDGLLDDGAGLIPEATQIARDFLDSKDQNGDYTKTKGIQGADIYITAMERIMQNGEEKFEQDVKTMKKILDARKGSYKSLDILKQRYNVFMQFIRPVKLPIKQNQEVMPSNDDDVQANSFKEEI